MVQVSGGGGGGAAARRERGTCVKFRCTEMPFAFSNSVVVNTCLLTGQLAKQVGPA